MEEQPPLKRKVGGSFPSTPTIFRCMLKSMRVCNRCKKEREDDDFNANGAKENGKQTWCKECTVAYNRRWYLANKEKHRAYVREHDKRPRKPHLCKHCKRGEPEATFYIKKSGERYYRRFICMDCDALYRKKYPTKETAEKRENTRKAARSRVSRSLASERHKHILTDSKRADKIRGRANDLDRDFIREAIANGCMYCGDTSSQMTLDRIDNAVGHLKSNVVPACIRCNYFRRDLPYAAWKLLIPAIRRARKLGLLDGWHSGTKKNREMRVAEEDVALVESI